MKPIFGFLFVLIISFAFSNCGVTRSAVIGRWHVTGRDTLNIYGDHTFTLEKSNAADTTKQYANGTWWLYKTRLYFQFDDHIQRLGGNCRSWSKRSKNRLVQLRNCQVPTNKFYVMTKVD